MVEIEFEEYEKMESLYDELKNLILSKSDNETYKYDKHQHHLYEESEHPGISKGFFNEYGEVEFVNIYGDIIFVKIWREHAHKHNGWSGLNSTPNRLAFIAIKHGDELEKIWELNVESWTLHYKAIATSIDIPKHYLYEKPLVVEEEPEETQEEVEDPIEIDPRNLLEEVLKLADTLTCASEEKKSIVAEMKEKIKRASEEIMKNYSSILEECDKKIDGVKSEMGEYDSLVSKYSTFNGKMIGNAIKELISLIECEDFTYMVATHIFKRRVHGPIDSWEENDFTNAKMIIRKEKTSNAYESPSQETSELARLVNEGNALLFSEERINVHNDNITFYSSTNGKVESLVNYGKFGYIKDFVDKVIQFRFERNLEKITENDLVTLMQEFLSGFREKVIKNFSSKFDEKILGLNLESGAI